MDPQRRSGRSIRRQKSWQMYGRKIYLSHAVKRAEEGWRNGGRTLEDDQTHWGYRKKAKTES